MAKNKYQEQIENSVCFGSAYDATAKECKNVCQVAQECKAKCNGKDIKPASPLTTDDVKKSKDKTPKTNKPKAANPDGLPDFKNMTMDDLLALAKERGCDGDDQKWKNIESPQIKRMQLTMALKKTYM